MDVAVVVLAAGGSSRMGRPKQLLPWNGRTLLRRAAEVAAEVAAQPGCGPAFVVLGHRSADLAQEVRGLPVEVIENPTWAEGPGSSVRAAVEVLEPIPPVGAAVFLLCDQPHVDAAHVGRLIAAWHQSGRPMAASGYANTAGVPALFARECFPALRALDAPTGARQLLAQRPGAVTVVPFPAGAVDLDTPEDYARHTPGEPARKRREEPHVPGE